MKNQEQFLTMEEIILQVAARARHGVWTTTHEKEAVHVFREWFAVQMAAPTLAKEIHDYVYYTHLVENDKVLVIGVQQAPGENEDPDKLFYCEVVRLSMHVIESWVAKGKPTEGRFLTEQDVEEMKNRSHEWTDSAAKFVEFLNDFIKRTRE